VVDGTLASARAAIRLALTSAGDHVELSVQAYRVLRQVIEAMRQNLAVTVVPQTQTMTTQQAATCRG
jgi:hypothetical protein